MIDPLSLSKKKRAGRPGRIVHKEGGEKKLLLTRLRGGGIRDEEPNLSAEKKMETFRAFIQSE